MSNPINSNELFCHLSSASIASIIRTAEGSVCYAGPGILKLPPILGQRLKTICMHNLP